MAVWWKIDAFNSGLAFIYRNTSCHFSTSEKVETIRRFHDIHQLNLPISSIGSISEELSMFLRIAPLRIHSFVVSNFDRYSKKSIKMRYCNPAKVKWRNLNVRVIFQDFNWTSPRILPILERNKIKLDKNYPRPASIIL